MPCFYDYLDNDLAKALMVQLRDFWTYNSTAIEGNSLTLGETAFVLREGLAVGGKPLKDHLEVAGHARAIDLIYDLIRNNTRFMENELFALHRAVEAAPVFDDFNPVGGWKKVPNATVGVVGKKQVMFDFAAPEDVSALMESWFELYHELDRSVVPGDKDLALISHVKLHASLTRIHPFCDGNGRMARLVANLPVLKSGLPPIIVPQQQRRQYIDILAAYHFNSGRIRSGDELLPDSDALWPLVAFCKQIWGETFAIVENINHKQQDRHKNSV